MKETSRKIYTDRLYYFFRLRISLWTREINSQIVTIFPRPWKYFIIIRNLMIKNKRKVSHLAQNRIIIILYYIVFSLISTVPQLQLQLRIIIYKKSVFSVVQQARCCKLLQAREAPGLIAVDSFVTAVDYVCGVVESRGFGLISALDDRVQKFSNRSRVQPMIQPIHRHSCPTFNQLVRIQGKRCHHG